MKLLYTLTTYPPSIGGAQIHQHLLARHLIKRHTIQVVSHWDTHRTDWLLGTTVFAPLRANDYMVDGVSVRRMGSGIMDRLAVAPFLPSYYFLPQLSLPFITRRLAPHMETFARRADLIHNVRIGREGISVTSLKLARRYDIPFVLTPVHHPRWTGWRFRPYINLYQKADAVIALTRSEKEMLIGLGVREERIHVTGIGPVLAEDCRPEAFREKHDILGPMVLFLGQHYSYKGWRQLLDAAPDVWKRHPDTVFVFVGPPVGGSERVFAATKDPRVRRLGTLSLQEKTDALSACTLLCVPSTQESFGSIYTEAWSFRKPVIGCDIPAVSEVIDNGTDGYLVSQRRDSIADRIDYLLDRPEEAAKLGEAGYGKVQSRYTWPRLAESTEKVYLLARAGAGAGT